MIYFALFVLVYAPYALWRDYLAVMNLKRTRDNGGLHLTAKCLGFVILALGYLQDFFVNVLHMSVLFLEVPKELTVTARLTRHIEQGSGWRQSLALWLTSTLLDAFDPAGKHR